MNNDFRDFEQFMRQRDDVARAYVRGDAAPLGHIVTHEGQATFFSPQGGYVEGADNVFATYQRDATAFEPGGDSPLRFFTWLRATVWPTGLAFSGPWLTSAGTRKQFRSTYV